MSFTPKASTVDYSRDRAAAAAEDEPIQGLSSPESLTGLLVQEMRRAWKRGEQPGTETFLALHPELWHQPLLALEVIYEEIHLRQAQGQKDVWQDVYRRFPQWREHLEALYDCHHLLDSPRLAPQFPAPGESLGEYQLVAELGRGAEGRVFLATQPALANRPVVLKLTPRAGREHLCLARLQHTNVVPLYAAREDRVRQLRVLCMPYFGGATLTDVLRSLLPIPLDQRNGQHLVEAVDQHQTVYSKVVTRASGPRGFLARASYVQAICWIGAGYAEALHYAHERGLLHLDLKPSNLLIAADGQPMLLDFHLAREPIAAGLLPPDGLGGTPAYMAPEQRSAAESVGEDRLITVPVDARADVYSLALCMYEALGGPIPFQPGVSPSLRHINPRVGIGLSDMIERCLAADPSRRYTTASALAIDLRRHLTDRPLLGVSNRSLAERWRKWRRRQPATFRIVLLMLLVLATTSALALSTGLHVAEKLNSARTALSEGRKQLENHHHDDAEMTLRHGLALIEDLPLSAELRNEFRRELERVDQTRMAADRDRLQRELHSLAEQMRVRFDVDHPPLGRSLMERCRALWDKRTLIVSLLGGSSDQVAADLRDLAILWADLDPGLATTSGRGDAQRRALKILDEARALLGDSAVLHREVALHRRALGLPEAPPDHSSDQPKNAWDHWSLGRSYYRSGDLQQAHAELRAALALEPHGCWPNYYYGLCAYRLGQYEDAALAFSTCIGAAPNLAGFYYNRGLALARLKHNEQARSDYDRALALDPDLAVAYLNRGMLRFQEKDFPRATADLHRALELGADPAAVDYNLALIDLQQNQRVRAIARLRHALQLVPTHPEARQLLDKLTRTDSQR